MAKKQLTPVQYKEKMEKKVEKRKKFFSLFIKTVAVCIAIAVTYSAIVVANTKIGLSTVAKKTTVTVGGSVDTNVNNNTNTNTNTNIGSGSVSTPDSSTPDNSTPDNSNPNSSTPDSSNPNNSTQGKPNQDKPNQDKPSQDNQSNTGDVMSSKTAQFDLFVKAFNGVKKNAKSVTIVKKNAYNYNNHVKAGMLSGLGETLMSSLLVAEDVNETYTGADINNFPPSGATCGLTQADVESINCKEDGDYYVITVVVKGAVNPVPGKQVGAVASILTKQSIQDPIKDVPLINSIEPKCDYKSTTAEAKIEKSTGNLVEYYFDLPMILFMDSYEIGLGFEEWWTVAY